MKAKAASYKGKASEGTCCFHIFFSSFSPVKDKNPLILIYKFHLHEWVPPGISLYLKYQFLKLKTESLTLRVGSTPIDLGLCEHSKFFSSMYI